MGLPIQPLQGEWLTTGFGKGRTVDNQRYGCFIRQISDELWGVVFLCGGVECVNFHKANSTQPEVGAQAFMGAILPAPRTSRDGLRGAHRPEGTTHSRVSGFMSVQPQVADGETDKKRQYNAIGTFIDFAGFGKSFSTVCGLKA